jgi:hypothetical protein
METKALSESTASPPVRRNTTVWMQETEKILERFNKIQNETKKD